MIIHIYSDGSGNSFGKAGGWAFCIIKDGVKVYEESGAEASATNNTMELSAALNGLYHVASKPEYAGADITLVSDSQLVLNFAAGTWQCKKMHLLLLASKLQTVFKKLNAKGLWVKGHSGNEFNEVVDRLAGAARENMGQYFIKHNNDVRHAVWMNPKKANNQTICGKKETDFRYTDNGKANCQDCLSVLQPTDPINTV